MPSPRRREMSSLQEYEQPNHAYCQTYRFPDQPPEPAVPTGRTWPAMKLRNHSRLHCRASSVRGAGVETAARKRRLGLRKCGGAEGKPAARRLGTSVIHGMHVMKKE